MPTTPLPIAPDRSVTPDVASEPPATGRACANCGHAADGNFCPHCGQETHDLHRSISGIVAELLDTFAGWDSKVPMSIGLLVARPGALTVEFLRGHRVRYLRPLRLYLTMSVLFFLSVGLVHTSRDRVTLGGSVVTFGDAPAAGRAPAASRTPAAPRAAAPLRLDGDPRSDSALKAFVSRRAGETGPGAEAWLKHRIKEGMRAVMRLPPEQRAAALQNAFFSRVGNVIFVLMPIFAAFLGLLYRRARLFFAEHFVFALHVHAFAMCALTCMHVLGAALPPRWTALVAVGQLWLPVYLYLAMRRVYGESRGRTAVKLVALSALYGPILLAATAATALYAIMQLAA